MLRSLSGRTHEVITGLFLIHLPGGVTRVEHETTRVTFAPLTDEEIDAYVATGEPFDKAGGYAIQGRGGRFVTRVEGCHFNVVGLPLPRLLRILRELGWRGAERRLSLCCCAEKQRRPQRTPRLGRPSVDRPPRGL